MDKVSNTADLLAAALTAEALRQKTIANRRQIVKGPGIVPEACRKFLQEFY